MVESVPSFGAGVKMENGAKAGVRLVVPLSAWASYSVLTEMVGSSGQAETGFWAEFTLLATKRCNNGSVPIFFSDRRDGGNRPTRRR